MPQSAPARSEVVTASESVRQHWRDYRNGQEDNSFYVWQWISLGLMACHPAGN